ncbi:MAG: hypothetical protein K2X81_28200 [Candidatus Obscuribacterales bacterium]|nr:hypothetical protein [Candidatus Obscuribacterales bacterium]
MVEFQPTDGAHERGTFSKPGKEFNSQYNGGPVKAQDSRLINGQNGIA